MFVDDTNLVACHNNINGFILLINNKLIKINTWFQIIKLIINIDKTNFIIFHSKCKLLPNFTNTVKIDNVQIALKNSTKFLGIIIDQNLNWKKSR